MLLLLPLLLGLKNHCGEITPLGSNLKIAQWVCSLHLFCAGSRGSAGRLMPVPTAAARGPICFHDEPFP